MRLICSIVFCSGATAENYFKIPEETALGKKLEELLPALKKMRT